MIIKVKRGDSAEELLIYQRRLDGTPEEQAGARLFAMNGIRDVDSAGAVLNRAAMRSGRAAPIVHIIIRAERGLSDDEWRIAIGAALEEAGLASHAWAAFRHDNDNDDPGDHMHIATVAADRHGAAPPRILRSESLDRPVSREEAKTLPKGDVLSRAWDSHLGRRLMTVARRLEDQFGLRPLARDRDVRAEPCRTITRVSQGERDRERRTGIAPFADLLDLSATQAALDEGDYDARRIALAALDLELRPFIRKNGDDGLRLHRMSDPTRHCPASALGDRYSLKAMDARSPVTFVHWYRSHPTTPEVAAAPAVDPAATLRGRYEEYVRNVVAQQQRLREERITVAAWQKRERAKALARRKAAMPVTRSRSTRIHRAAAMTTYRIECERIDKEATRQREAIDARRIRRLDFVGWLEMQANADPVAAQKLLQLRGRGAVVRSSQPAPAPAMAVSTAPSPTSAPEARSYSPAELAAMVAERDRLTIAAATLMAEASILKQHTAVEALATRLSEIGVKLILEADRQGRRVRVERDSIKVDDATMMSLPAPDSAYDVLQQAKATHLIQQKDEAVLAVVIRHAEGFTRQAGEDPASWLQRFWKDPVPTRWLTPAQSKAIRQGWQLDDDQRRQLRDMGALGSRAGQPTQSPSLPPIQSSSSATTAASLHRPAPAPPLPPALSPIAAPAPLAAGSSTIKPNAKSAAVPAADRRAAEPSLSASLPPAQPPAPAPEVRTPVQQTQVLEAIAMLKAPRSSPAVSGSTGVEPANATNHEAAPRKVNVVSTAPPVTSSSVAGAAAPGPIEQDSQAPALPASTQAPTMIPSERTVVPRPDVAPSVSLIADWLTATYDAKTEAARRDSQALAARLVQQDDLAILDSDLRARAIREADAHERRLFEERRIAEAAVAPTPIAAEGSAAAGAAPAPPPDRTSVAAEAQRRAAAWHVVQAGDPMKR